MSIRGLGVDIVEIDRLDKMLKRWGPRLVNKVFTPEEIEYCQQKQRPAYSFAARFAAKEAFAKATGAGIGGLIGWKDFSVQPSSAGGPAALLSPKAQKVFAGHRIHLSLSHSENYAIATVLIEKE